MAFYVLGMGFTIWMAVETVRRGQVMPWLWICLLFGPIGSAVYFFTQVLPTMMPARGLTPRAPKIHLDQLRREAERLDKSEIWTDYAAALRAKRKPMQAVDAASKAVAKDPENLRALSEHGHALVAAGHPQEALAPLGALTEREPYYDMGDALYALAQAQQMAGDQASALATMRQLTERHTRPMFLYALALLQAQCGDRSAARATLETIVDDARHVPRYAQREARRWASKASKTLKQLGRDVL